MGIRAYFNGERLRKGLEPTKCGLCGGTHGKLELIQACGTCMDGLANYMGGDASADRIMMGARDATSEVSMNPGEAPTAGSRATQGSAARAENIKGSGTDSPPAEPTAVASKEGPRSDKAIERTEDPATRSNTNASKVASTQSRASR